MGPFRSWFTMEYGNVFYNLFRLGKWAFDSVNAAHAKANSPQAILARIARLHCSHCQRTPRGDVYLRWEMVASIDGDPLLSCPFCAHYTRTSCAGDSAVSPEQALIAVRNTIESCARQLLTKCAPVSIGNEQWLAAAHRGDETMIACAINAGMDLEAAACTEGRVGYDALRIAGRDGHETIVGLLLVSGAPHSKPNSNDEVPLHSVAWANSVSCARLMIAWNARSDLRNQAGWTPFELAARLSHTRLVEVFRLHGIST